jgi:protein SCO1/2
MIRALIIFSLLFTVSVVAKIPDVEVIDQNGRKQAFYTDLVKDQIVAINFIFTQCETICPVSGAYFGKLLELAKANPTMSVRLISVTLDAHYDTPEKLKTWAAKFGHNDSWSLVTGTPANIDQILKALGAFTADKNDHAPLVLVGSDSQNQWKHIQGFTSPDIIWKTLTSFSAPHPYFPDTELVDHQGKEVRFYTDLVKDKVVVIHCFFSTCQTVCPILITNFKKLNTAVGEKAELLSITLDPTHDTPEFLGKFATALDAGSNWRFLTGKPANVEHVLAKLGFATEDKENHSNIIIIGNEKTGLWKKARGTASADEIAEIVNSAINDEK